MASGIKNAFGCMFCDNKYTAEDRNNLNIHIQLDCPGQPIDNRKIRDIYDFSGRCIQFKNTVDDFGIIYIVRKDARMNTFEKCSYKIGKTNDLISRLSQYKCGSQRTPRLYYYFITKNYSVVERRIHEALSEYRDVGDENEINKELSKQEMFICPKDDDCGLKKFKNIIKKIINEENNEAPNSNALIHEPVMKRYCLIDCNTCNISFCNIGAEEGLCRYKQHLLNHHNISYDSIYSNDQKYKRLYEDKVKEVSFLQNIVKKYEKENQNRDNPAFNTRSVKKEREIKERERNEPVIIKEDKYKIKYEKIQGEFDTMKKDNVKFQKDVKRLEISQAKLQILQGETSAYKTQIKELTSQNDSYIKTIKKVMKDLTLLIPQPVEEINPLWEAGG